MTKINAEEYEVLKSLDDKWKYLVRNNMYGAKLEAHTSRPYKMTDSHWSNGDMTLELLGGEHLFQFIQWEDEPYKIAELIEEYEDSEEYKDSLVIEYFMDKAKESEEKEVKKQKLIKKWESAIEAAEFYGRGKEDRLIEYMRNFVDDLNRLDEPEVLSQEFIDKHKVDYDNWMPAVPIVHLQNLLVPKPEEITEEQAWEVLSEAYDIPNKSYIREAMRVVGEHVGEDMTIGELKEKFAKPVIPKFVADFIESYDGDFYSLLYDADNISSDASLVTEEYYELGNWLSVNSGELLRAVANGYEVEKEQKYYVLSKDGKTILLERWASGISPCAMPISEKEEGDMLTEQEIKDYDERYWPFAVKVEELEE